MFCQSDTNKVSPYMPAVQCRPPDRPWVRPDGGRPAGPPAGSVTDDDRRRRQTTDISEQNNTGPLGGPVIMRQSNRMQLWTTESIIFCRERIILSWAAVSRSYISANKDKTYYSIWRRLCKTANRQLPINISLQDFGTGKAN